MNRDFAKYLLSLPDLGRTLWLHLYAESTPNGNSMVDYRELSSLFRVSIDTIKKVCNIRAAEKKKLITIQAETETLTVINFKTRGRPNKIYTHETKKEARADQKKKKGTEEKGAERKKARRIAKKDMDGHGDINSGVKDGSGRSRNSKKPHPKGIIPSNADNLPDLHQRGGREQTKGNNSQTALVPISSNETDLKPSKRNFEFSEDLKRRVIYEYCQFWKSLQASQQVAGGIPPDYVKTFNPIINPTDIGNLRDIARFLSTNGFKTDDLVVSAFRAIFANWHYYREFIQTGTSTIMIKRNLNEIVLTLQTLKNQTLNGNRKKEKELNKNLDRINQKDYSHLDK